MRTFSIKLLPGAGWLALAGMLTAQAPLPIAPVKPQGLPFVRSYKPVTVPPLRLTGIIYGIPNYKSLSSPF